MNYKFALVCLMCLIILLSTPASSKSQYVNIEYFYNGHLITDSDSPKTPKPLLKIGEPFKLRFEVTCYKRNFLSVMLTSIGEDDFDIIEGPTLNLGEGTRGIIEANETRVFEWIVTPNEEWAGGSAPIDFYYQMTDLDTKRTIISSRFTAAYVTISNEYYEPPATTKPGAQSSSDTSSPALPAFTLLGALMTMYMVYVLKKK
ncbi:MAG: sarcinarray family MAST domain-containing protein [Methanolobus sp.]|uniref:sarcinarray family MAST domain-containing protein n=1 Tax=Methanolobus sp. TaxID=1874737 RepID=UPI002731C7FA|nr:sarcinarray family MAST domain-containing protein [Methanolobus sp.]MDP2215664.1 sarcinarray family MAST domain-containing protein [Methanolobus sp.]